MHPNPKRHPKKAPKTQSHLQATLLPLSEEGQSCGPRRCRMGTAGDTSLTEHPKGCSTCAVIASLLIHLGKEGGSRGAHSAAINRRLGACCSVDCAWILFSSGMVLRPHLLRGAACSSAAFPRGSAHFFALRLPDAQKSTDPKRNPPASGRSSCQHPAQPSFGSGRG